MGKCQAPNKVVWRHRSSRASMGLRINALRAELNSTILRSAVDARTAMENNVACMHDPRFTPSRRAEFAASLLQLQAVRTSEAEVFERKVACISTFGEPGTSVAVENLVQTRPKTLAVDSSNCWKCGSNLKFDHSSFQLICQFCRLCSTSIFVVKDASEEVVANRVYSKTSHGASKPPKPDDVTARKLNYFRGWLQQFSGTAPPTPPAVFDALYRELAHVHVVASTKCRPTHVATVLKNYGFKAELGSVVRITMECNGCDPPKFDSETVERMVGRYSEIEDVQRSHKIPPKMYSFEFVCTVIFWAEGCPEYLSTIFVQKSRNVLKLGDDRVVTLLRGLAPSTKFDWSQLASAVDV